MSIFVNVINQKMVMSSCNTELITGSQQFVKFKFNFDEDWDGLVIFAQFRQGKNAYNQYLDEDNCVYLPPEIGVGTCTLMLYGSYDKTIGTTNYLTFKIGENILISDAQSTDISESLYNQLVTKIGVLTSTLEKIKKGTLGYITPQMFGAKADGVTDDTEAIKQAVDSMQDGDTLYFVGGTYRVSIASYNAWVIKIAQKKNISIIGDGNAVIKINSNKWYGYKLLWLHACENFTVSGLTLYGDRETHDYSDLTIGSSHECGYGIEISTENNELCSGKVINCDISNMTGDAIIAGCGSVYNSTNVKVLIKNCELHHCRRQGVSILDSKEVVIDGCHIHHIGTWDDITGASPMSGIDSEPGKNYADSIKVVNTTVEYITNNCIVAGSYPREDGTNYVHNFELINCVVDGGAVQVNADNFKDVFNCQFTDDSEPGVSSAFNLVGGQINVTNCLFRKSGGFYNTYNVTYSNCTFIGTDNKIIFRSDSSNCTFKNVQIRQDTGLLFYNNHYENCEILSYGSYDIPFNNCTFKSFVKATGFEGNENKIKFYSCVLDTRPISGAVYVNCTIEDEIV